MCAFAAVSYYVGTASFLLSIPTGGLSLGVSFLGAALSVGGVYATCM